MLNTLTQFTSSNNLEVPLAKTAKAQPSFSVVVALAASKEGWPISQFHPTTPVKPACSAKAAAAARRRTPLQTSLVKLGCSGLPPDVLASAPPRGAPHSRHVARRIAEYT